MKIKLLFFIIISCFCMSLSSQELLENNPIKIEKDYCQKGFIKQMLQKHENLKYADINIQELKLEVWDYNSEVDKKQQKLIDRKNLLIDKRQEIEILKSIIQIPDRIKTRNASIAQIRKEVEENLSGLGYKGIYLFATKMSSPYTDSKELRETAIRHITPIAVEHTNGSFISSITTLKKKESFDDEFYRYIKEEIQGTCNVEAEIINTLNRRGSYFIFLAKINTKPLQKKVDVNISEEYGKPENTIILNTLKDNKQIKNISDIGIPKDEIRKIKNEVKQWEALIEAENERIQSIEHDFILAGKRKTDAIYEEIDVLDQEFFRKSNQLKTLINDYTDVDFSLDHLEKTINLALQDIDNKISNIDKEIIKEEENRLFAKYQIMVSTSGDYFTRVADETIKIQQELIDTYAKVENYVRVAELENDNYRKSVSNDTEYQRYFDKLWIFPEPGEGDFFRITIVIKFVLEKPGKSWRWW
ncbi:MAG: hypothetical protein RBR64_03430 [Bacteroidales bacterium]|nr:hypothetical protein [Bacteroidales bacterium]